LFEMAQLAHKRLDTHEARLNEGQSLFVSIQSQLGLSTREMTEMNSSIKGLQAADLRRETREKTLAEVAVANQQFWRFAIPVLVTLLFGLIGAIVWLVSNLPRVVPS
jgi:hypothetical protein